MKRSIKETGIRVLILMVGLTIAHLGVTLFLMSDLGADPFNVLVQGIFRTMEAFFGWAFLTHGNVHRVICFLIILVLLVVDRSYVKIGTILCMFCGGPIIDLFTWLLGGFLSVEALWMRIAMLAAGCVILAYGMTIVIKSDAGTGPNDLVALVISEKSGARFFVVRVLADVVFAGLGFLMGGVVGIGTIICAFLVGPVADFFLPINGKMVEGILGKFNDTRVKRSKPT